MKELLYMLVLRSEPSPVPAPIRLRRLLKFLMRTFGFRCVECREVPLDLPESLLAKDSDHADER